MTAERASRQSHLPALAAALLLIGAGAGAAGAQPEAAGELRRVDPGVEDVGPLGVSFRETRVDLRVPADFSGVYRVPAGTLNLPQGGFARRAGGVTAVFPQSVYADTRFGPVALVPPGTIFYLGGPAPLATSAHRAPASGSYVDRSVSLRVDAPGDPAVQVPLRVDARIDGRPGVNGPRQPAEPTPPAGGQASILSDDSYRAARVGDLIDAAARAR